MLRLPFFSRRKPATETFGLPHPPPEPASPNVEPYMNGYWYEDRFFSSFQEVQCYRYLKSLGIPPGKMHLQYRVGVNHFDFFPLRRMFWEHHPIKLKLGHDIYKYGKQRRAILDAHGYECIPLVVSDMMFGGVTEIYDLMRDNNVDFRRGDIPEGKSIVYVKSYEKEWRGMFNVLHEALAQY